MSDPPGGSAKRGFRVRVSSERVALPNGQTLVLDVVRHPGAAAVVPFLSDDEVREVVDLATITDCEHVETWIEEVAAHLGQQPPAVADVVHQMIDTGKYRWSDPVGALINT